MEENKQEKLLNAIFSEETKPISLRFSLKLENVVVDVAIKKSKKAEAKKCCVCPNGWTSCKGEKK